MHSQIWWLHCRQLWYSYNLWYTINTATKCERCMLTSTNSNKECKYGHHEPTSLQCLLESNSLIFIHLVHHRHCYHPNRVCQLNTDSSPWQSLQSALYRQVYTSITTAIMQHANSLKPTCKLPFCILHQTHVSLQFL